MVLNVHRNHKASWGRGEGVWRSGKRHRENSELQPYKTDSTEVYGTAELTFVLSQ